MTASRLCPSCFDLVELPVNFTPIACEGCGENICLSKENKNLASKCSTDTRLLEQKRVVIEAPSLSSSKDLNNLNEAQTTKEKVHFFAKDRTRTIQKYQSQKSVTEEVELFGNTPVVFNPTEFEDPTIELERSLGTVNLVSLGYQPSSIEEGEASDSFLSEGIDDDEAIILEEGMLLHSPEVSLSELLEEVNPEDRVHDDSQCSNLIKKVSDEAMRMKSLDYSEEPSLSDLFIFEDYIEGEKPIVKVSSTLDNHAEQPHEKAPLQSSLPHEVLLGEELSFTELEPRENNARDESSLQIESLTQELEELRKQLEERPPTSVEVRPEQAPSEVVSNASDILDFLEGAGDVQTNLVSEPSQIAVDMELPTYAFQADTGELPIDEVKEDFLSRIKKQPSQEKVHEEPSSEEPVKSIKIAPRSFGMKKSSGQLPVKPKKKLSVKNPLQLLNENPRKQIKVDSRVSKKSLDSPSVEESPHSVTNNTAKTGFPSSLPNLKLWNSPSKKTGLLAGMSVALLAGVFVMIKKTPDGDVPVVVGANLSSDVSPTLETSVEELSNLQDIEKAKNALLAYFKSKTPEEAIQYVVPDYKLSRSMNRYWEKEEFTEVHIASHEFVNSSEGETIGMLFLFNCGNSKGKVEKSYPVYVLKGHSKPYVDWRYPNQIEDITIADVLKYKIKGKVKVRCGVTLEDYYNFGYEDKSKWLSVSCRDTLSYTESELGRLDCYVDKHTTLYQQVVAQFTAQSGAVTLPASSRVEGSEYNQLNAERLGVDELRSTNGVRAKKSNAKLVLEIEVEDPVKKIGRVTKIVSSDLQGYFLKYQLPLLKKTSS